MHINKFKWRSPRATCVELAMSSSTAIPPINRDLLVLCSLSYFFVDAAGAFTYVHVYTLSLTNGILLVHFLCILYTYTNKLIQWRNFKSWEWSTLIHRAYIDLFMSLSGTWLQTIESMEKNEEKEGIIVLKINKAPSTVPFYGLIIFGPKKAFYITDRQVSHLSNNFHKVSI